MNSFNKILVVLLSVMTSAWLPASAVSFPCSKAQSKAEKAICADAELSSLDEHLARYYGAAREALREAQSCLVADQRAWLRKSRDACQGGACLKEAYLNRLAVLDALQPGASALRGIELPRRPPLVWMLAPALDEVAAPRHLPTRPLAVQGQLLNEVGSGDGFVLKTPSGTKHLVLGLMFLEGPAQDALAALAQTSGARYEVRGETDLRASGNTAPAFAPSRCAAIYRITP
jgi:uncharacterized protein